MATRSLLQQRLVLDQYAVDCYSRDLLSRDEDYITSMGLLLIVVDSFTI